METFEHSLHIDDEAFDGIRQDADMVLQELLKNMANKGSDEGSVTIKIDVTFHETYVKNTNPKIDSETRKVISPGFSHKISSVMQIKSEKKGGISYDDMEMVWDDDTKSFIVKPIADTEQRSIFDADFRCVDDEEDSTEESEQHLLEGRLVVALPAPSDSEDEESDAGEDGNAAGGDAEATESCWTPGGGDMDDSIPINPPEDDVPFTEDDVPFTEDDDDDYAYKGAEFD